MADKDTVERVDLGGGYVHYEVGGWSFDDEDKDLRYIDSAIAAWSAWRDYVAKEIEEQVL